MAPQTRSAARKQAALESPQRIDLPTNTEPKDPKDIPELETTPTTPKPKPNPFCLSKEQIDRICGYLAYLSDPSKRHAIAKQKHCDNPPALLPTELDYLVSILVPFYRLLPGPNSPLLCRQLRLSWTAVTAKFNHRFPKTPPRKKEVLMCAMYGNFYRVVIKIFRERCRRARAGEDNAGSFSNLTSSELDRFFTVNYDSWRARGYGVR